MSQKDALFARNVQRKTYRPFLYLHLGLRAACRKSLSFFPSWSHCKMPISKSFAFILFSLIIWPAQSKTITSTITQTVPAASSPTKISSSHTSDSEFRSTILNSTNFYRAQHNATVLKWNETLASYAAAYVRRCKWKHSVTAPPPSSNPFSLQYYFSNFLLSSFLLFPFSSICPLTPPPTNFFFIFFLHRPAHSAKPSPRAIPTPPPPWKHGATSAADTISTARPASARPRGISRNWSGRPRGASAARGLTATGAEAGAEAGTKGEGEEEGKGEGVVMTRLAGWSCASITPRAMWKRNIPRKSRSRLKEEEEGPKIVIVMGLGQTSSLLLGGWWRWCFLR